MCTLSLWRVFLFWKDIKVGVGVVPPAPQVRTQVKSTCYKAGAWQRAAHPPGVSTLSQLLP